MIDSSRQSARVFRHISMETLQYRWFTAIQSINNNFGKLTSHFFRFKMVRIIRFIEHIVDERFRFTWKSSVSSSLFCVQCVDLAIHDGESLSAAKIRSRILKPQVKYSRTNHFRLIDTPPSRRNPTHSECSPGHYFASYFALVERVRERICSKADSMNLVHLILGTWAHGTRQRECYCSHSMKRSDTFGARAYRCEMPISRESTGEPFQEQL